MSEPIGTQKQPYVLDVEAGNYAWCACGRSKSQPYCDGSHQGTGIVPVVVKIEANKKVAWCGCRQSSTVPYCDGSHRQA